MEQMEQMEQPAQMEQMEQMEPQALASMSYSIARMSHSGTI
jgi:hypothetical protein